MKKRSKTLLSLFLSTMMVFSVVPATALAESAPEETPAVQEDTTEAVQDNANTNEAEDPATEDSVTEDDVTEATTDSSNTDNDAAAQADTDENKVTVSGITIQTPVIQFKGANAAVAEALTKDVKIDESDPAIKGLRKELENLDIVGGEAGIEDDTRAIATCDAEEKKNALSEEQINTVVGMYQQYLKQWADNANILGVQNPFFRTFNDKDDDLGILGEMLALGGHTVDEVRNGTYSYDDLTGMIINFLYGDQLGITYYGKNVTDARDEVLSEVKKLGDNATDAQKLLVINDWLAHHDTFDMGYIMNSNKADNEKPMVAPNKDAKRPHYTDVYKVMDSVYRPQITAQFHDPIKKQVEDQLLANFYENAIQNVLVQSGQSEEDAKAYVEANKDAIDKDPEAFVKEKFPDAADSLKEQADAFIKDAEENGVAPDSSKPDEKVTVEQMTQNIMATEKIADLNDDGENEATANEAIEAYCEQAATGMTDGVIDYWEGSQFGALGMGTSVCLGYSKAYSYFVQCLDKTTYLINPEDGFDHKKTETQDGKEVQVCDNWKRAEDLYYNESGNIDINAGYTVDLVRITFESEVTMYGHKDPSFASDHYWNAVKVNGKWYYVDPCYTDVYTEVMSRDRVETDGDMSHAYFLFSDTSARSLYSGNMKKDENGNEDSALKTLYKDEATDKSYETAWMSRAASNVYYKKDGEDIYAYYLYDSTDLFSRASSMSNTKSTEYKLVRHKLTGTDGTDGDNDYETLINFTDKVNSDDTDTFVSVVNKDGKMEKNEALTKLYSQFVDEQSIYPSIGLTAALYGNKIYFNVSNDVMSYDLSSGEIETVKEYNEVSAKRDRDKLFGGMAFTTCDKDNADFTVNNHPIAGLTIKEDGTLVVSIATNFAFISGKTGIVDQNNYGYAYEETDYNPNYTNYKKYASIMGNQKNDNDEFMWSANFVDTVNMSTLTGATHQFEDETVPAFCGRDAFTERRCSDPGCGLIEAGTRKTQEGTAHKHHYIKFHETYYTTVDEDDENSAKNEADNYVCPECGACITEPVKSNYEQANSTYEKRKKIWEDAQKNAAEGHAYTATDAKLSDDNSSITFQNLRCESCYDQKDKLDCLLSTDTNETNKANYASIEKTLSEPITVNAELDEKLSTGTCDTGVTAVYKATGKTEDGISYTATVTNTLPAGKHQYTGKFEWKEKEDADGKGTGEYTATVSDVKCSHCKDEPKKDQISVTVAKDEKASVAATCETAGKNVWVATASIKDGDKEIGTLTDEKDVELKALGHDYDDPVFDWTKGENNTYTVKAKRTCKNDPSHVEEVDAKVKEETKDASCTEAGTVTYTATATFDGKDYTDTKTEDVNALGHNYGDPAWKWSENKEDGTWTATAVFTCTRCKDNHEEPGTVTSKKTEPTCDTKGNVEYTAKATFNGKEYTGTKNVELKALGHDYGDPVFDWTKGENNTYTVKAKRTCKNDPSHVEEVDAKVKEETKDASCTEAGTVTYTATATFDGKDYIDTKTEDVNALGHNYGEPTWKWSKNEEDDSWTAVATFTCARCKDEQQKVGKVTSEKTEPTCEEKGNVTYTAKVTLNGKEYTGTKVVELNAKGHNYGKPVFNWTKGENNTYTATATFTCANDAKHVKTVDAKVKEKSEGATCTEGGKITYTATATFEDKDYTDTKTEDGTALGHNYTVSEKDGWKWTADKEKGYTAVATFVCSRCKDSHDVTADVTKEDKNGQIIYTATAKYTDETGKEFTATATKSTKLSVSYKVHRQDYDWEKDWKKDGEESGTVGESKRLEAIKIKLPDGVSGSIEYRTHIQDIGWEKNWSKDGAESGTEGQSKRLEAIQIRLTGEVAENYDVYYSVHAQNFGWLGWAKNGEEAGTAGYGYRLEAIKIQLVVKGDKAPTSTTEAMKARLVGYQTHVQDYGTQAYVYDGAMAGTQGESKRMESIRMKLPSSMNSSIQYRSHVQNIGWEKKWASNGALSGTTGQAKRLEAIQIKLSGDVAENYDVYYRVHAQDYGWLGWAKNGESSGTEGCSKRLEAIEVRLVPKGTTPNLPTSTNEKAFIKK